MTSVDNAQWIDVYRRLEKPLYNVVYRVIWDAAESQDVVQDAFLRCWRRKDDIRADGFNALPISPVVRAAFDGLPEALRNVVLLNEIAGMTYPEVAAALGVAEGTIGSRRSRALALLRERLEAQGVVSHEC
jgi:RNA polymerase sigma-70 factor (ECF subfamily)